MPAALSRPACSHLVHATLDTNRANMAFACPQVKIPWGESVLAVVPVISPAALAQDMAGYATGWTRS